LWRATDVSKLTMNLGGAGQQRSSEARATTDDKTFNGADDVGTTGTSSRSSAPKPHGFPLFRDRELLGIT
jgi:hypothetical protein